MEGETYIRVLETELKNKVATKIEIIGYVVKQMNNKVILETGAKTNIEIHNFTSNVNIRDLIEVRGEVIDNNKINFEEYNNLPNEDFNLQLFENSLTLFNKYKLVN